MKPELDYDTVQFIIYLIKNYDLSDPHYEATPETIQRFYRGYQQYAGDFPYGN